MSALQRVDRLRGRELGNVSHPKLRSRAGSVRLVALNHKSAGQQKIISYPPCHDVLKYLIPSLISLLQVKFQGKNMSAFETHPANMWAFFISICIYCMALGFVETKIQTQRSRCTQLFGRVILISGTLSSFSLISVFLPRLPGQLIFIVWAFLPVTLSRNLFKHIYYWLRQRIINTVAKPWDKFKKFARHNSTEHPPLPSSV